VTGLGFGSDTNRVWFVSQDGADQLAEMNKTAIARVLWDRIAPLARDAATLRAGKGTR
jgi:phosphopantothenoylcysteine synthetase/decarboxylase